MSSFTPWQLQPVEHLDQRQLDVVQQPPQLQLVDLPRAASADSARTATRLRAPAARRRPRRPARCRPARSARRADSGGARGRSGTPPPSCRWHRRTSRPAAAPSPASRAQRLPVVRDQRPLAPRLEHLRERRRRARQHLARRRRAPPSAGPRRRRATASAASSPSSAMPAGVVSRSVRLDAPLARRPAGAASCSPSASSSRRSGSRSSKRVNTSRSRERSGVRSAISVTSTPASIPRWSVARLLRDARQVGVLAQVLAPLLARDLVDVLEHLLERPVLLQQLGGGLVADAGDARDVVRGVALQPDEVGHELGRDAVALDHALAVVDAGVGDPARGGHDPHAAVRRRAGRRRGRRSRSSPGCPPPWPARPGSRSRRRPRSPRRARSRSRTPRPAARGAATARAAGRGAACARPCRARIPARGPTCPASQTTIVAFGPYSVRILTSMLAKPKIALVGSPREVAIDSGSAKNAR